MSKQPKVPETKDVKPNREQRRHPGKPLETPLDKTAAREKKLE